jgi:hypothetical protein
MTVFDAADLVQQTRTLRKEWRSFAYKSLPALVTA